MVKRKSERKERVGEKSEEKIKNYGGKNREKRKLERGKNMWGPPKSYSPRIRERE